MMTDFSAGFFRDDFEKRPIFVQNSQAGQRLSRILDIELFEEVLWVATRHRPDLVQIIKVGAAADAANTDPFRGMEALIEGGFSFAINYAEEISPRIALFARTLQISIGIPINTTIFFTPPGGAVFSTHHDKKDFIAIQTLGRKCWTAGEGTDLSLDTFIAGPGVPIPDGRDHILEEKDALYVPRGCMHAVKALDCYSLHMSAALTISRPRRVLNEAMGLLERRELGLRHSSEWWAHNAPTDGPTEWRRLSLALKDPEVIRLAQARLMARDVASLPQLPGRVSRIISEVIPTTDLLYERRPGTPSVVYVDPVQGSVHLSFPGLTHQEDVTGQPGLRFPSELQLALEFITTIDRAFRLEEVPGSADPASVLAVLDQLRHQGFLHVHARR